MSGAAFNRLAHETSPYLLQHASNPVDWFPWGEEALEKARAEDKPIFLSIGYAACHWCHVMERESFEDEATAELLDRHFVSIKVDREERPDLDGIYMDAVQAMNRGQGGWPMSVFLTPSGRPFFAGTYFPSEPRHGMPSFTQVVHGIAEAWRDRRDEVESQGSKVTEAIGATARLDPSAEPPDETVAAEAYETLRASFDRRWGGFGGAPKFPQPMTLEFCLRLAVRGVPDALDMVTITLDRMADGGIHDQLGGGFARYATDAEWHVPHFEKMLYDNAQLAQLYTRAWLVTRDDRYREVATGVLEYLFREMQHPEGAFFSSQDADSEGVEGRFFTWDWSDLVERTSEGVAMAFGASPAGNWEGSNVLWHPVPTGAVAAELGMGAEELGTELAEARAALFLAREERVRPATDDKILTAWNALAIRALAEAGRAFDERSYVDAAERCAAFIWRHLRDERGRLLRSWRHGKAGGLGFADDHALLCLGLLTLYQTTGEPTWFERAREVAEELLRLFTDQDRGGFFQTGADARELVVRPKELYDNAVPSGNSAAAEALLRLSMFTGDPRYEEAALASLELVRDVLPRAPSGFGHALCALDLWLGPAYEVAIVGAPDDPATVSLLDEVQRASYLPNIVLAQAAPEELERAADVVALLRDRSQVDGRPAAFVCERFACRVPVTSPEELRGQLLPSPQGGAPAE
jgi:uncharacterized protein